MQLFNWLMFGSVPSSHLGNKHDKFKWHAQWLQCVRNGILETHAAFDKPENFDVKYYS